MGAWALHNAIERACQLLPHLLQLRTAFDHWVTARADTGDTTTPCCALSGLGSHPARPPVPCQLTSIFVALVGLYSHGLVEGQGTQ